MSDPQADLQEAKIRFTEAVNNLNPMSIVEKKPLLCTGCAFGLGFLFTSLFKKIKILPTPILPIAFQIGDIAMKYFLARKK